MWSCRLSETKVNKLKKCWGNVKSVFLEEPKVIECNRVVGRERGIHVTKSDMLRELEIVWLTRSLAGNCLHEKHNKSVLISVF